MNFLNFWLLQAEQKLFISTGKQQKASAVRCSHSSACLSRCSLGYSVFVLLCFVNTNPVTSGESKVSGSAKSAGDERYVFLKMMVKVRELKVVKAWWWLVRGRNIWNQKLFYKTKWVCTEHEKSFVPMQSSKISKTQSAYWN